jgi:hypothetical protein
MRRAPFWSAHACRRSTAALTQGSISSQRLSFRPGFLGRGLHGRYPPSPVPVQGCTSHPGHNAGRHDAQAAREQAANPPAGTALAPMTRCASAPCPSRSEDCDVTGIGTSVKENVTPVARMERSAIRERNTRRTGLRSAPSRLRAGTLLAPCDEPGAFKQFVKRHDVNVAGFAPEQLKGVTHYVRSSRILRP